MKWARKRLGLTQAELAAKAGVSKGAIGNIEAGTRHLPRDLVAISRALEVTPEWLATGDGESPEARSLVFTLAGHKHDVDAYTVPPIKSAEDIVSGVAMDGDFRFVLLDDALAPDLPKGTELVWSTSKKPSVGSVILVVDADGALHARRFAQGAAAKQWFAMASSPYYATFDIEAVRIAAVASYEMRPLP